MKCLGFAFSSLTDNGCCCSIVINVFVSPPAHIHPFPPNQIPNPNTRKMEIKIKHQLGLKSLTVRKKHYFEQQKWNLPLLVKPISLDYVSYVRVTGDQIFRVHPKLL